MENKNMEMTDNFNESFHKIMEQSKKIVLQMEQERQQKGWEYNILSVIREEDRELYHEKMLYAVLTFGKKYYVENCIGDEFVKMFMEEFALPKVYQSEKWDIEMEHITAKGDRIDLYFVSQGKKKKYVVVELKINANDQPEQLWRYEQDIFQHKNMNDYRIIYLTLDGKRPSEQSQGNISNRKLYCGSFLENVVNWLGKCIDLCIANEIEESFIKQYKILLEKKRGESNMKKEIISLVQSQDDLLAAIQLRDSLPIIQGEILYDFMLNIQKEFEKLGYSELVEDIVTARDYYTEGNMCPAIKYSIQEYEFSSGAIVHFGLGIEVSSYMDYYFGYFSSKKSGIELVNSNVFKKGHKRLSKAIENAITEKLGIRIRDNQYNSIVYKAIEDPLGDAYGFDTFTQNCIKLIDPVTSRKEAKRIAKQLVSQMALLKEALNEEDV